MTHSPAAIERVYQLLGSITSAGSQLNIYLHKNLILARAIRAEPEDVNGQLRHRVVASLDFKTRPEATVISYFESPELQEPAFVAEQLRAMTVASGISLVRDDERYPRARSFWERCDK